MLKEDKGITLIALIITIIVLIILAAIGVKAGRDSIRASKDNRLLTELDMVQHAVFERYAKYKLVNNTSYLVGTVVSYSEAKSTADKMKVVLPQDATYYKLTPSDLKSLGLEESEYEYIVNYSNGIVMNTKVTETNAGEALYRDSGAIRTADEADPMAGFGAVNEAYIDKFGKKVTGTSVPAAGSNWRLFYADSNYVYLISESIGNYALHNKSVVKGWGTSTISTLAKNFNSKYTANGDWELKSNGVNLNGNIKTVAALLDTSQWTEYKSSDAVWAVGAPTLEMFIASYNATHTIQLDSIVKSITSTGYAIKKDGGNYSTGVVGLGNTDNIDKAIYCNDSYQWWLASPSEAYRARLVNIGNDGGIYNNNYDAVMGIRPLVCILISKIGNGITITDDY